MKKKPLDNLLYLLKKEEFDCILVESADPVPHEKVVVSLGKGSGDIPQFLDIYYSEQPAGPLSTKGFTYKTYTFSTRYSLEYNSDTVYETARFVNLLNTLVEIPGFEINELEQLIRYRYIFLSSAEIEKELLLTIVGMHIFAVDMVLPLIDSIVSGKASFEDILDIVISQFKEFYKQIGLPTNN